MKEKNVLETVRRWESYYVANSRFPSARRRELSRQLELTSPQEGETVVEIGTGNGILTFPLAEAVGKSGQVITHDYQKVNLDRVNLDNKRNLPIRTVHQTDDYEFDLEEGGVDRISTIAAFHHYDDRSKGTGTSGREKVIRRFYRMLKEGGKLIIGDVAHDTPSQRYFDAIDNPEHCYPDGHAHDFPDAGLARKLCEKAGFRNIEFMIEGVPWEFDNESKAAEFVHQLHNARCTSEESLRVAKEHLPHWEEGGKFYLGWELFYLVAKK